MNNFDIGRAIVDEALRLRGERNACTQTEALAILDAACERWRGESAEFESQDPIDRTLVHPEYDYDTDPIAPFGLLLREAFWPEIDTENWARLAMSWGLGDEDLSDGEHRLHHDWYERVEFPFHQRYGLYGYDPGKPMPYVPPIRESEISTG